jgi:UDP-glucose 4-epimerase
MSESAASTPRRILVTGAAGFIGSHLVDALMARGYAVVAFDNLSMGRRENFAHHEGDARFRFVLGDVRDRSAVGRALEGCQLVAHLAAYKIPRYGHSLDTLLVNSFGTEMVFEAARETGAKVVIASTSDVYGKSAALPFREDGDLVLGPSVGRRWSYAASKLYNEHLAFAYQEAFGLRVSVLRFFGAYGPRQHRSWWGGPQSVFIEAMLRGEKVPIHGDGQQTRTFTFVGDTVAGVVAALEHDQANGEILNIGGGTEINILSLAQLVHRLLELPGDPPIEMVPYASFSRGYEDVRRRVPDTEKAEKLIGFKAVVPLEEGLRRTIAWQRPLVEAELRDAAKP